jgi:Ca-activated chloride channel family protein
MNPFKLALAAVLVLGLAGVLATESRAAGLLVADGGLGGQLEIEEHTVEVVINNGIAVTHVNQVFRNLENRQVEALYTFPVPKGASVANFSMWIGGREMIGEVVEKERAREIYNSYKQVRRDPGLLEQSDYRTFEMRIFPIAPNAEQRVQISYYQELDFDNDWATYVYPLATTTRERFSSRTTGRFGLSLSVASEVPIVAMESPSHGDDFAVAKHSQHHVQASFETTGGDLNRDLVLAYHLSRPRTGLDLIASMEPREDGYFLMTLTVGEELAELADAGMDYAFVLDISGSMNDDGKLSLSRSSLEAFVQALGEGDRFEIITFNVAPNNLFREMRGADVAAKQQAEQFLRSQNAKGGTVLQPAIRAAYRYKDPDRPLNVVILSDGMTKQNERATLLRMAGERPGGTRIFAIGVGNDVNRPLLEQIAEDAGGLAAFVSRADNFERQARSFRRKLLRPAVSNIEMEIDSSQLYDLEPRQLPNLYHGAPVRLYGRYRTPGPVQLTLRGDLGGERFEKMLTLDLPGEDADNPEIERMWAWHKVQRLLKEADRTGNRAAVLDEIIRLGEGFSIVTEYTSFLVLENDAEYQRWKIDRRNALRVERDRRSQQRVRDKLADLRLQSEDIGPVTASRAPEKEPTPVATRQAARPQPTSAGPTTTQPRSSRGHDFGFGGALDPMTAAMMAALGALAWLALRRNG